MTNNFEKLCGWIDDPESTVMAQQDQNIQTISFYNDIAGDGQGKVILLHKIYEQVTGKSLPVWKQAIGDCVSFGYALGVSILMAMQESFDHTQEFITDAATEPIYGGSRIEIGNLGISSSDGSTGIWAAQWVKKYGILLRQIYDTIDLKAYSGLRAQNWGQAGVPDFLEPIARLHPVQNYALVTSYEEARDAIANGYPVVVSSNRAFKSQRDAEGFSAPYGTWAHCMCFVAVDDASERPGLLCCNSWGNTWIDGPKRHDQPDGSFWVDATVADSMLGQRDSYALSNFVGFERQNVTELMQKFNLL
ncbi:hypothetical protein [Mucilaginibacter gilvus]|uniref:Peptidase C1A papain C-terminal domain-containing protein n=1 Tax=Mucilaginibacter gilvus TaxID=2305909 RepID=A0A444MLG0_9SPHI|nr:hypothetical protein [Mucilaginibacter gilvus]RWY50089.1 hypothetical protein EPL05_15115 [Mucilaginibacter gilvus]